MCAAPPSSSPTQKAHVRNRPKRTRGVPRWRPSPPWRSSVHDDVRPCRVRGPRHFRRHAPGRHDLPLRVLASRCRPVDGLTRRPCRGDLGRRRRGLGRLPGNGLGPRSALGSHARRVSGQLGAHRGKARRPHRSRRPALVGGRPADGRRADDARDRPGRRSRSHRGSAVGARRDARARPSCRSSTRRTAVRGLSTSPGPHRPRPRCPDVVAG